MLNFLRRITPKFIFDIYHRFLGWLAAVFYGNPSEKLTVVGVTGTNGKSTTVYLIAEMLKSAGHKAGYISTISFSTGEKTWLNTLKMTTPGRFFLQRMLKKMVGEGCKYAILEMSSESVLQHRHKHINFDAMVFTNLTPEHLERHGGFESYKRAKLELFKQLKRQELRDLPRLASGKAGKNYPSRLGRAEADELREKHKSRKKIAIINKDDKYASEFLDASPIRKITYSLESKSADLLATNYKLQASGSEFIISGINFKTRLLGKFNLYNCLAAIATVTQLGLVLEDCLKALKKIKPPAGRLESIDEGQNFAVVVDYAPEPYALAATYDALNILKYNRLIHILGSTGGGRDKSRRTVLGQMAGKTAEIVIVANEDPYDEDPAEIINAVAAGAKNAGKKEKENLFKIPDRRQAIKKAFMLASAGDLVLLTGKGSEQAIVVKGGKKIPWDERGVAREELRLLPPNKQ